MLPLNAAPARIYNPPMIPITVNGRDVSIEREMPVDELLDTVDVPPNYLAVEINGEVVPREEHARHIVSANDAVEVVTLVGGG